MKRAGTIKCVNKRKGKAPKRSFQKGFGTKEGWRAQSLRCYRRAESRRGGGMRNLFRKKGGKKEIKWGKRKNVESQGGWFRGRT